MTFLVRHHTSIDRVTNSRWQKRFSGTYLEASLAQVVWNLTLSDGRSFKPPPRKISWEKGSTDGASPRSVSTGSLTAVSFPYQWVWIRDRDKGQGIVRIVIPLVSAADMTERTVSSWLCRQKLSMCIEIASFYCHVSDSIPSFLT